MPALAINFWRGLAYHSHMTKTILRIGTAAACLAFFAAVPAFAQTQTAYGTASTATSSATSSAVSGTSFADVQFQLALLTVQIQALANTPILTTTDQSQALTILQSVVRVLGQLSTELQSA